MSKARTQFTTVARHNFSALKSLVIEQAKHHSCDYAGVDNDFIAAIEREKPVPQILLMHHAETLEPSGYVLYNDFYTLRGREFYIEDIAVSSRHRNQGVGIALIDALKETGREQGIDGIFWLVTDDNHTATRFYRDKVQATWQENYGVYDCAHLFTTPPQASRDYEVHRMSDRELDIIESSAGSKGRYIRAAAEDENSRVYVATSRDGTLKAVGIANVNFSTFRTVYGQKLQMTELDVKDDKDAGNAFKAVAAHAAKQAVRENHTGHLDLMIDKKSAAQAAFVQEIAAEALRMSDNPASVFNVYAIGRQAIHASSHQSEQSHAENRHLQPYGLSFSYSGQGTP